MKRDELRQTKTNYCPDQRGHSRYCHTQAVCDHIHRLGRVSFPPGKVEMVSHRLRMALMGVVTLIWAAVGLGAWVFQTCFLLSYLVVVRLNSSHLIWGDSLTTRIVFSSFFPCFHLPPEGSHDVATSRSKDQKHTGHDHLASEGGSGGGNPHPGPSAR